MLNIKIILLTQGYAGYNVYNVWEPKNYNELSDKIIILLYNKDIKHYDYLEIKKEVFTDDNYIQILLEKIKNNIEKRSIIYKKIYPKSIRSSPNIYNEMYLYWRSNCSILPDQRLNESSNKYLYKSRFIELAWKKYYL